MAGGIAVELPPTASVSGLASPRYGCTHLFGGSAADMVAGGYRTFQGEYVEYVLLDSFRELA